MATCPYCGEDISGNPSVCPHCESGLRPPTPAKEAPLFRKREALIAAGVVAVIVAATCLAYHLGNPMRYARKIHISVDSVEEVEVAPSKRGAPPGDTIVQLAGHIENTGERTVRYVAVQAQLKDGAGQIATTRSLQLVGLGYGWDNVRYNQYRVKLRLRQPSMLYPEQKTEFSVAFKVPSGDLDLAATECTIVRLQFARE